MLPKEYQEVEYLESTEEGGQWLDTDFIPNVTTEFECVYEPTKRGSGKNLALFGCDNTSTYGGWGCNFIVWDGPAKTYFARCYISACGAQWGNPTASNNAFFGLGRKTRAFANANELVFDYNNSLHSYNKQRNSTYSSTTIYVFARHDSIAREPAQSLRIYSLIFSEDDEQKVNLVPCYRKADEKPGMYDTVRKIFLTNQGTGEFICGPAVYNALLRETNGLEMGYRRELLAWQMYKKSKGPIYKINPPIGITDTEHAFFADGDRDLTILLAHKNTNISSTTSHANHGNATVLYDTTTNNYASFMGVSLYCSNGYPFVICGFAEDGNYAYNSTKSYDAKLYAPYPTRLVWRHKKGTKTATLKHQIIDSENTFNLTSKGRKDFYPCTTTLKIRSLTSCVVTEVLIYDRILTDAEERMYIKNGIAP